ncbi:MAG: hypothetical protein AAB767_02405 [Patescibacteria group bacterium]
MNPAEEIVKFWLQEQGYFLQSSIRLPKNKEIDILAIDPKTNNKFHIEVSVSVRCANYDKNAEQFTKEFSDRKFDSVEEFVTKILREKYTRILVVGNISFKNKDIRQEFITECRKLNLEIVLFQDILNKVRPLLGTKTHLNSIIKAIQLAEVFEGTNE